MAANLSHSCTIIVKMPAGAAIVSGDMVVLSANTVIPAANNCTTGIFGVAMESAATGDLIAVGRNGIWRFTAAADLACGALAYVASVTTIDTGSAADHNCGVVVDTEPAATGEIDIEITPSDICPTYHHV